MAKSPLALLMGLDGTWYVKRTENSMRGHQSKAVIFFREPTTEELETAMHTQGHQKHRHVFQIEDLLEENGSYWDIFESEEE